MDDNIKTFLIVPIYGRPLQTTRKHWPPNNEIIGWKNLVTGEPYQHNHEAPVGAMWFACWLPVNWTWDNEVGPHLHVRVPNGPGQTRDWDLDSRASNCALDEDRQHRCWIRHGDPPNVHVDKAGTTCAAGAGSIAMPQWHGYLDHGLLVKNRR